MQPGGWDTALETGAGARRAYRRRSFANLTRMGHCAPTVARTVVDVIGADGEWLVRLSGGLPGGVANTGAECGGVTAGLLLLGLRYGGREERGLPVVVEKGRAYCSRFTTCNRSLLCSAILGERRVPWPCVKVMRRAPELLAETIAQDTSGAIPAAEREACAHLCAHLAGRGFHCAHAVLGRLERVLPITPELLAATAGFVGGTALQGMTCSALAAGVMAISLRTGAIEGSRPKVARMLLTMVTGGDALADGRNAFNASMRRGNALARAFVAEFGNTQCRALTDCAFSSEADVERYVTGRKVERCAAMAQRVAELVEAAIEDAAVQ